MKHFMTLNNKNKKQIYMYFSIILFLFVFLPFEDGIGSKIDMNTDGEITSTTNFTNGYSINNQLLNGVPIYDLKTKGKIVFAASYNGIIILNTTNIFTPDQLTSIEYSGGFESIFIDNEILYALSNLDGLIIYNISDLNSINNIGNYSTGYYNKNIVVENDIGLIGQQFRELIILNVSDPKNIFQISELGDGRSSEDIKIQGDFVYSVSNLELRVINITDIFNPTVVNSLDLNPNYSGIAINVNNLFLMANGIRIIDLRNPSDLTVISRTYNDMGSRRILQVGSNIFYITGKTISGFNISDLIHPNELNQLKIGDSLSSIIMIDYVLYIGSSNGIIIVEVNLEDKEGATLQEFIVIPTNPTVKDTIEIEVHMTDVSGTNTITMHYKLKMSEEWNNVTMVQTETSNWNRFKTTISPIMNKSTLEVYFISNDNSLFLNQALHTNNSNNFIINISSTNTTTNYTDQNSSINTILTNTSEERDDNLFSTTSMELMITVIVIIGITLKKNK